MVACLGRNWYVMLVVLCRVQIGYPREGRIELLMMKMMRTWKVMN